MATKIKGKKVLAVSASAILIMALIGIGLLMKSNKSLNENLSDQRLMSETLLSEKLSLDKQIGKLRNDMAFMSSKNDKLDKMMVELKENLSKLEAENRAIRIENKKIKTLESMIAEIQKTKSELESQITGLNGEINQLMAANSELNRQNASLMADNENLSDKVKILSVFADNFRMESLKGKKDKLTVSARVAKKLTVGFDLPPGDLTNVNFKITTPQGKVFTSKDQYITSSVVEDDRGLVASISSGSGNFEISKRIEMNFQPKEKLTGGVYNVEILNKNEKLGSCQIRLRKF